VTQSAIVPTSAGRVLIDVPAKCSRASLARCIFRAGLPSCAVSAPVARELRTGLQPANLNIKTILARLERKKVSLERFLEATPKVGGCRGGFEHRIPLEPEKS